MPDETVEIHLTPEQAKELVDSGDAEVIDVRRDYEWEESRLAEARHIEVNDLTSQADSLPRDRPVLFVCRGGSRSGFAAEAFREAGFDAYHIDGGLRAWLDAGFELEPAGADLAEVRPAS